MAVLGMVGRNRKDEIVAKSAVARFADFKPSR